MSAAALSSPAAIPSTSYARKSVSACNDGYLNSTVAGSGRPTAALNALLSSTAISESSPISLNGTPGSIGECGETAVAGGRVIWMVERSATTTGGTAILARLFTYVASAGGWVEWLQASDPTGERWSDVNVIASDLTGDAVAELLVGFRNLGDTQVLEYDVVGYDQDGIPVVLAHPDASPKGVVVVAAGQIQDYGAEYPGGEPACGPPSYLHRTIAFDAGFFRVIASETVLPSAVPASQL